VEVNYIECYKITGYYNNGMWCGYYKLFYLTGFFIDAVFFFCDDLT